MWVLVSPDNEITKEEQLIDPEAVTKPGWRWLKIIELPIPVYNSKFQILEGPNFSVIEDNVNKYWIVRDKTAEEIETDKQSMLGSIPKTVIDLMFEQENKIRQLQQETLLTKDEFINYIKSLM